MIAVPDLSLPSDVSPTEAESKPKVGEQITEAATTPLGDLNLVHAKIPPVLLAAQKGAYALPADRTCTGIGNEILALDAALGADIDAPATPSNPALVERGVEIVGGVAVSGVRSLAEWIMPFRGLVRKLSGADEYSKEFSAAITAGITRRAFLKGLGQSAGCLVPAAPRL